MSLLGCGKRSSASFFDDDGEHHSATPDSKRTRCSADVDLSPANTESTSPPHIDSPIDRLRSLSPAMDLELLERALEASGNDLEAAMKYLNNLHLESNSTETQSDLVYSNSIVPMEANTCPASEGNLSRSGEGALSQNRLAVCNLPRSGSQWVEKVVSEMSKASNMDDARAPASGVLEGFKKSIHAQACAEASHFHQEQIEKLHERRIFGKVRSKHCTGKRRSLIGAAKSFSI